MNERLVFAGLGGLGILLLLVAVVSSAGRNDTAAQSETSDMVTGAIASVSDAMDEIRGDVTSVTEALGPLGDRIDVVESALQDVGAYMEAATSADAPSPDDVAARVDALLASEREALRAETEALRAEIAALGTALREEMAALASGEDAPPAPAPAAAPAADAAPAAAEDAAVEGPPGLGPGQTAVFADGALRVFVSRLDPEAGDVRVSINGDAATLGTGSATMVAAGNAFCEISVDAVSRNGAVMNAVCGDALPEPAGIGVGETALFEEGALRIFLSRVTGDAARLSTGDGQVTVPLGSSAPVTLGDRRCRVYVDGIDRAHAALDAVCGDAVAVSDVTGPGGTAILADGAARVFVSAVDNRNQTVRVAVNGLDVVTASRDEIVDLGAGCTLSVEDIGRAGAEFGYACVSR